MPPLSRRACGVDSTLAHSWGLLRKWQRLEGMLQNRIASFETHPAGAPQDEVRYGGIKKQTHPVSKDAQC